MNATGVLTEQSRVPDASPRVSHATKQPACPSPVPMDTSMTTKGKLTHQAFPERYRTTRNQNGTKTEFRRKPATVPPEFRWLALV